MKILVIGESCKDIFCYGACERICPEAPVPVLNFKESHNCVGMAMNVQKNIHALGVDADLYTNESWEKIRKTRFIDYRTNYMFMRLDENEHLYGKANVKNIKFADYDAIIISDYNKGFLTKEDIKYVASNHDCVFLDSKKTIGDWSEVVRFVKINKSEFENSKESLTLNMYEKLIVTLGSEGCMYQEKIYSVPKVEIKDLSGAGDTFMAGLAVNFIQTRDIIKAIKFANECATRVVQKKGVSTI